MSDDLQLAVFRAKLAETAERYDEMIEHLEGALGEMCQKGANVEETELFYKAYHRAASERRHALRVIEAIKESEGSKAVYDDYQRAIAAELLKIALGGVKAARALADNAKEPDSRCLLTKMEGDHNRYMIECGQRSENVRAAEDCYRRAVEMAAALTSAHPIRLQVYLSLIVLQQDHLKNLAEAHRLAAEIVEECAGAVESTKDQGAFRDSAVTFHMIKTRYEQLSVALKALPKEPNNRSRPQRNDSNSATSGEAVVAY